MLALKKKQEKKKGNTKNAQHDEHLGKSAIRIRLYVVVSERDLEKKKERKKAGPVFHGIHFSQDNKLLLLKGVSVGQLDTPDASSLTSVQLSPAAVTVKASLQPFSLALLVGTGSRKVRSSPLHLIDGASRTEIESWNGGLPFGALRSGNIIQPPCFSAASAVTKRASRGHRASTSGSVKTTLSAGLIFAGISS